MRSLLHGRLAADVIGDAELVVGELTSNSVIHARVEPDGAIGVDVGLFDDRLHIAVTDGGSTRVPQLIASDPARPGGKGLLLVVRLACEWGVKRDSTGRTRVWCDLDLADR